MFNREELKSITKSSDTAKNVMEFLAGRKRFRRQTNIYQFQQAMVNKGYNVVSDELMDFFKALQNAGVGHLIIGRRGNPNKFRWHYNLKDLGKAAISKEPVQIEELGRKPRAMDSAPRKRGRPAKTDSSDYVEVTLKVPRELLKLIKAA